jgi:hypothetical protein
MCSSNGMISVTCLSYHQGCRSSLSLQCSVYQEIYLNDSAAGWWLQEAGCLRSMQHICRQARRSQLSDSFVVANRIPFLTRPTGCRQGEGQVFDLETRLRSASPQATADKGSHEVEVDLQALDGAYISITSPEEGDSVVPPTQSRWQYALGPERQGQTDRQADRQND